MNAVDEAIERLDPIEDSTQIMRLLFDRLLPRRGRAIILNLLYTLGFMRVCGQLEGARAIDRDQTGKIHRRGDLRADQTISHFIDTWIFEGPFSEPGARSIAKVRRLHDHYAQRYPMSNETFVHTIAFFTVQFEHLLRLVGAEGFSDAERTAQVTHWRAVGELLGVRELPQTWEQMEDFLNRYESSPHLFGRTVEAHRCAESLIRQFSERWLPVGLRWAGRPLILSLHEDHVLRALGQQPPSKPLRWLVRRVVRTGIFLQQWRRVNAITAQASR